jgi:peptidyl-prolyl cis-trans isomerase D
MLTTIREKTQGIIATFIVILIVIPFALWGVNSYFDSGVSINVAKVDGLEISQTSYRRALDRLRDRVDPKALDSPQFKQLIVDSLIDQALLAKQAQDQGYRLGDARLANMIHTLPAFQRDGRFDTVLYEATLRREGLNIRNFEERLREEGLAGQIQAGLSQSAIVTEPDVGEIVRLLMQEREVAYAVINPDLLIPAAPVSAQEIEQYYSSHPDLFQIPEKVRIEYLLLSASNLSKGYQPSEEDIKRIYTEEAARYVTPERRRASHILISLPSQATEDAAKPAFARIEDIASQARDKANFGVLAKKYSMDSATATQEGDLGEVRRGVLPKELEDVIYQLKPGEISKPVRTSYGYHLVKLTSLTPEKHKPLSEVRQELIQFAQKRKAEEKFFELSEKFRNLVYEQPDSLAPAAKVLGLETQKSDWFTRTGGSGIAANPKVVQAAFDPDVLSQLRNSDAIEISADAMAAVRVLERQLAGRKPLVEVRAQIERNLKLERGHQAARRLADEWLQALRADGSLEALAKKHGFKYQAPRIITRQQIAGTEARVAAAAFRALRPENGKPVYDLVDLGDQGYAVMAILKVRASAGKPPSALYAQAKSMLTVRRGDEYYSNYRAGLRSQAKIKIYSDQL